MKLSEQTIMLTRQLDKATKELQQVLVQLDESIKADSNGALGVCTGHFSYPVAPQLFDERHSQGAVMALISSSLPAEQQPVMLWSSDESTCYAFQMQGRPFRIVVDNAEEE